MAKTKPGVPVSPQPKRPLKVVSTARFKQDSERMKKRGKDTAKLLAVISLLRVRLPLLERHRDHALGGEWKGWRDCHIEPNWVLFYKKTADELILGRTGTHSDLGI